MMLFFVDCEHGNGKFIFARSLHHAAEQFVTWQMANEVKMGRFVVERITIASKREPDASHLRSALALGAWGIGYHDDHRGWVIGPIGDERPHGNES